MNWTGLDTWIVVAGALSALACALLGNFLLLQRLSMMGDAISHAVLPGVAVAFLLTGSRASLPMFIGAAAVGVLTAVLTEGVHRLGKVEQSAAMGVVFTGLFALGLILVVQGANAVDLDPGCVLYGAIELAPLDTRSVFGFEVPRAVLTLSLVLLLDGLFVALFYKELKLSSFDPALATTLGYNATLMNYLLMTLVAITTVAAFETVGSILVIAMLIVPAATAQLLTDRLSAMIAVSLVVAALCAVLGHLAAITVPLWFGHSDTNTAGMMATVAGAMFFAVMLVAPRHGVLSRLTRQALNGFDVIKEDVLGLLYRCEERPIAEAITTNAAFLRRVLQLGPLTATAALARLRGEGKVARSGAGYRLTPTGRSRARELVRTHRLWETYLHQFLRVPTDHVHASAERLEHVTTAAMRARLAERTGQPVADPHGKQVPADEDPQ